MDNRVADDAIIPVTVLICVYNGGRYLSEAVQSVLDQQFSSFELLIINDGSSDDTPSILAGFKDDRIRVISNEKNQGLIHSLNIGLREARGTLIARMDADDICIPSRLQKQVDFLDSNPGVGMVGSWVQIIDSPEEYRYPLANEAIKLSMLLQNSMAHPSVMFRKKLFAENGLFYDPRYPGAEDYELWTRAIFKTDFANIGESLLHYRKHQEQVTQRKQDIVSQSTSEIKLQLLSHLQVQVTDRGKMIHLFLFNDQYKELNKPGIVAEADAWLYKIFCANRELKIFDEDLYCGLWQSRLFVIAIKQYDLSVWQALRKSYCFRFAKMRTTDKIKLFIKCLVKRKVG